MALTLVVEDGSGKADANSYLSLADADAFHEGNLWNEDWPGTEPADEASKDRALVTATRLLDQQWRWFGYKLTDTQALQWPRVQVPDRDSPRNAARNTAVRIGGYPNLQVYLPSDEVPQAIERATALLALEVVKANRETTASDQGIREFSLEGVMAVAFDLATKPDVFPSSLVSELLKLGSMVSQHSGTAKIIRA